MATGDQCTRDANAKLPGRLDAGQGAYANPESMLGGPRLARVVPQLARELDQTPAGWNCLAIRSNSSGETSRMWVAMDQ